MFNGIDVKLTIRNLFKMTFTLEAAKKKKLGMQFEYRMQLCKYID